MSTFTCNELQISTSTEADLGMFSMFGRTGAPQKGPHKRGPTKAQKLFHAAIVVCIAARVLKKMSTMTTVRVGWKQSGGGGIYILGAPHFCWTGAPLRVNPALSGDVRSVGLCTPRRLFRWSAKFASASEMWHDRQYRRQRAPVECWIISQHRATAHLNECKWPT